MLRNNSLLLLIFISLGIAGCEGEVGRKVKKSGAYYNLSALLDHQVYLLDSLNPTIEKVTEINGVREEKRLQLDSLGWTKELAIFYQADINDPVLKNTYEIETTIEDGSKAIVYTTLDEKTKIHYLKVLYKQNETQPFYITALFNERNVLYKAQRTLELSFNTDRAFPILDSYQVNEKQKILLKDTNFYYVKGKTVF